MPIDSTFRSRPALLLVAAAGALAVAGGTGGPPTIRALLKASTSASSSNNGNSVGPGVVSIVGYAPTNVRAGASAPVDIKITNTNNFDISVTQIAVSKGFALTKTVSGCSNSDFAPSGYTGPAITVPANGSFQLSADKPDGIHTIASSSWPQIAMPPTSRNQDACQGAGFSLSYTATAVKAK